VRRPCLTKSCDSTYSIVWTKKGAWPVKAKVWIIWKHALGSYSEDDGFDPANDNAIAIIRTAIVFSNLMCVILIIANVVHHW